MTEDELFQHIHRLISGTDITYKQIDSDLDEQGDITIFFSGLKTDEEEQTNEK